MHSETPIPNGPSAVARLSQSFALAVGQLGDPAILRVLAMSVALTLVLLAVAGFGAFYGLNALLARWPDIANAQVTGLLLVLALFLVGWFLFRTVAMAVIGLFSDAIVEAVERKHYPARHASAAPVPFARGLAMGLRSGLRAIGYNLLASPVYILLLVTGVGTLAALLLVNAVLLGRDLSQMVGARHPDVAPLSRRERWLLGGAAAALFLLPVVNILAPVLGAAMAVHMINRRPEDPS